MVGCSRALRRVAALLMLLLVPGCTTGMLLQDGRYHEQVARYEVAYVDDERLLLGYEVVLGDREGHARGSERREVAIALDALRANPETPVEQFEVVDVRIIEALHEGDQKLAVLTNGGQPPAAGYLAVEGVDAPKGFRLMLPGETPGRLYSGALYRVHHEWWVYPLLPLTAVTDFVSLPLQLAVAPPLFVMGE